MERKEGGGLRNGGILALKYGEYCIFLSLSPTLGLRDLEIWLPQPINLGIYIYIVGRWGLEVGMRSAGHAPGEGEGVID